MKQFMALMGACAMLALAACSSGAEEPKPMKLGPDTAKSEVATATDLAWGEIGRGASGRGAPLRPSLCIVAHSG